MKPCQLKMRDIVATALFATTLLLAPTTTAHAQRTGSGDWFTGNLVPATGAHKLLSPQRSGADEHQDYLVFDLTPINPNSMDPYEQLIIAAQNAASVTDSYLTPPFNRYVRNIRAYLDFSKATYDAAAQVGVNLRNDFMEFNSHDIPYVGFLGPVGGIQGLSTDNYYSIPPLYLGENQGAVKPVTRKGTGEFSTSPLLPPANQLWISFPTRWGIGLKRKKEEARKNYIATGQRAWLARLGFYNTILTKSGVFTLRVDGDIWIPSN